MTLMEFLVLLLISAIAGGIGQSLVGFYLGGCFVSAVVGFIGAYLGAWIAREFGFPAFLVIDIGGRPFPLIWSVIGSAILALALGLITRLTRSKPPRS